MMMAEPIYVVRKAGTRGWWWALWASFRRFWDAPKDAWVSDGHGFAPTKAQAEADAFEKASRLWPGSAAPLWLGTASADQFWRDYRVLVEGRVLPQLAPVGWVYQWGHYHSDASYPGAPTYSFHRFEVLKQTATRLYVYVPNGSDRPYDPRTDSLSTVDRRKLLTDGRAELGGRHCLYRSVCTLESLALPCWSDGGKEVAQALHEWGHTRDDCAVLAGLDLAVPAVPGPAPAAVTELAWDALAAVQKNDWRHTADYTALKILADALEDAGVSNAALLAHLRRGDHHCRYCWAVQRLLTELNGRSPTPGRNRREAACAR
jgi:hypothetical protein